ncbi:MAG: hypothetical protein A2293_05130 [Elusimicrobia bacterium RIFOXYB2_FULL_49_7]|nr:MAG: hypothetical protein A2293_05130 [Elusimicrobia bacterium RIFOXYB2_FULL_49_7]
MNVHEETLPQSLRVGLSRFFWEKRTALYAEIKKTTFSRTVPVFYLGAEVRPIMPVMLRAGLGEWSADHRGVYCFGATFSAEGFALTYAFNSYPDLAWDSGHRLGLSYKIMD